MGCPQGILTAGLQSQRDYYIDLMLIEKALLVAEASTRSADNQ
jgi:hypothetical protein